MPSRRGIAYPYEPDYAVPPGETLQETIDALGMPQKELAVRTGLTPKTINLLIKGRHPLTRATAIRLERVTGVPARMWNSLETQYRERLALVADRERLKADLNWLRTIPCRELIQRGAIEATPDPVELLARALAFFGVSGREEWDSLWHTRLQASFHSSSRHKLQPGPTAAWLRLGELAAMAVSCEPYDKGRFREAVGETRALTLRPPRDFRPRLVAWCADAGVAVAFVPEIKGCPAHGVTRWLTPAKALIQLSLRYRTDDQFWFSFFHEAGHVLFGPKRAVAVDYGRSEGDGDARADRFAANVLIHPRDAKALPRLRSSRDIVEFADAIGIAPGIVVGRMQKEGLVPYSHFNKLKRRFEWSAG